MAETTMMQIERQNLRYARAMKLTSAVMDRIDKYIPRRSEDYTPVKIHSEILEFLMAEGVELLTDFDRNEMGLAPRDSSGWTQQEIRAWDARLLMAALSPMPGFIPMEKKDE